MFRPKFCIHWFVASGVAISIICFIAASVLLSPVNANISFIENELIGLKEYEEALKLHIELCRTQKLEPVIEKINELAADTHFVAWTQAKEALHAYPSVSVPNISEILRQMIRNIGDESNLILDPALESYYAVDILIEQIPLFLIWGTSTNIKNMPTPEVAAHYSARLDHSLKIISARLHDSDGLAQNIADLRTDWRVLTNKEVSSAAFNQMLQHVQSLAESTIGILDVLLNNRLSAEKHDRLVIILIVVSFYLAVIALIAVAVRYYVSKREVGLAKERQKLIVQLAQKNDELDKFAHAAAHDLKEPIRTISCFATLLKGEFAVELTESALEYVGIIENASRRAEQMINDLLGYTRTTEEILSIESCDCNAELAAVLEDLKIALALVKPRLVISPLPVIHTVPSMFRRVVLNLIDNAIKYRRQDVSLSIYIDAEKQNNAWVFSIRDNGMGLAPEQADSVFEPFRRLEPTLHKEGSGIGLTSCRKIIERLGGKIWIVSEPDQGTIVYFSLPS